MNLDEVKKILIIRLSSLGDILLTTPLIRTLKTLHPHIEIDFLLRNEYADTLKYNTYLNRQYHIHLGQSYNEIHDLLKDNNYDFILDLQNNFRSRRITKALDYPTLVYEKKNFQKFLLVNLKIKSKIKPLTVPEKYANALPGFELDEKGLEVFLPGDIEVKINSDKKYIGICPGSRHFTKMWPKEYFVKLLKMIVDWGRTPLLLGGNDDDEVCEFINSNVNESVYVKTGNDLFAIVAHMKKCEAIICNDSGLMHLSSVVNIPLITIFGSTVKDFGFTPYKTKNIILENNSLTCRPCSHIGRNKCPKKHFECMNKISPESVFSQLKNFVK